MKSELHIENAKDMYARSQRATLLNTENDEQLVNKIILEKIMPAVTQAANRGKTFESVLVDIPVGSVTSLIADKLSANGYSVFLAATVLARKIGTKISVSW